MPASTQSSFQAEVADQAWQRRAPRAEDDQVLDHTWDWLTALPKGVRPVHLPATFPRIANDLSRLWPETASLDVYFGEKEFSPRPDRAGFPPLIKEELLALHVYSLRSRPPANPRPPRTASASLAGVAG